jgi:crotonobetainyl-CoA:carnitine CoA-transferase CaiB-like acyl-CoA transferase
VLVSSDFRWVWKQLTRRHGVEDPSTPEMTQAERIAARRAVVERFMAALDSWEAVEAAMDRMNIAWGQVRHGATLREQPTLAHRRSIVEIDDRAGGTRPIVQSPYRFSDARSGVRGPAPHRGEHNTEVLKEWLGKDDAAIAALAAAGVLLRDEALQA